MDPLSIVGIAASLATTIGRVVGAVDQFTRDVRDARREMGDISRELSSLKAALEMLGDDLKRPGVVVPGSLEDILGECEDVIARLEAALNKYNHERLSARVKYVWSGKDTILTYKGTLSAHRAALDLAIDIITLSLTREIKAGVDEVRDNTDAIRLGVDDTRDKADDIKWDTERILEAIAALQARLPHREGAPKPSGEDSNFMLWKYLEELTEYAETVVGADEFVHSQSSTLGVQEEQHCDRVYSEEDLQSNAFYQQSSIIGIGGGPTLDAKAHVMGLERAGMVEEDAVIKEAEKFEKIGDIDHLDSEPSSCVPLDTGPEGLDNFTWDIGIPLEYSKAGFESKEHKKWRESIVQAMQEIPAAEISPKNGKFYQKSVHYTIETIHDNKVPHRIGVAPIPEFQPQHEEYKTQAKLIKWLRNYSMSGDKLNYSIRWERHSEVGMLWTSPLGAALETQDWAWLDALFKAGAEPQDGVVDSLGSRGPRCLVFRSILQKANYLDLAADWNLAILKFLIQRMNANDAIATKECRSVALAHMASWNSEELFGLQCHAAELLLSTGRQLGTNKVDDAFRIAISARNRLLFDVLISHADVNFKRVYSGTPLHRTIQLGLWDMARALVANGADPLLKAEISDDRVLERDLTPIEFAAALGKLPKLNEVLGTKYKVSKFGWSKFTTMLKRM